MDNITALRDSLFYWREALDLVRTALGMPISEDRDSLLDLAQCYNDATYAVEDAIQETLAADVPGFNRYFSRNRFADLIRVCGEVRAIVEDGIIRYVNHPTEGFNPILAIGDAQAALMDLEDMIMAHVEDIANEVDGV